MRAAKHILAAAAVVAVVVAPLRAVTVGGLPRACSLTIQPEIALPDVDAPMLFAEHKKTGFWVDKNMMLPAPASPRAGCAEHGGAAVPSPEPILANAGRSDDGVQRPPGCGMFTCEALCTTCWASCCSR